MAAFERLLSRSAYCDPSAEFGQIGLALNRSTQQIHRIRLLDIESQASCADVDLVEEQFGSGPLA